MRFATVSKFMVLGLAILLAASAFAGTKVNLQLSNPVTVNGTTLKAGNYKLEWEGVGPNVELSFMQGKKVIAKAPAHVTELPLPAANDAVVVLNNANGAPSLTGVRFQGKKLAFDLSESAVAIQAAGSSE
jgi:hypothetical protein